MGEASGISLKAIGKQDTHLLSDKDEDLPFLPKSKRHSEFIKYHRVRNVTNLDQNNNWPFGSKIKLEFKPQNMGDLLSNMWLSLTLPKLESSSVNYADQVGRHIFKSITMYIDEVEVEKIDDDWSILHDELYIEMSEKVTNAYLLNRNLRYDSATLPGVAELARYETDLMIPIPFFFSRKYTSDEYSINEPNRPYFPLCLVHKQKIEFEIEFHKQSFFTDSYQSIHLRDFDIITEEITISNDERIYMLKNPINIISNFVKKHPTAVTEIGKNIVRNNLVPNIPVKCLHWFFRRQDFENEDIARQDVTTNQDEYYYQNRFNFSTSPTFDVSSSFFGHVMEYAYLYLLGSRLPHIRDANYNYYKYKIPLDVRLTRPIRNIYTYSFAIRPMNTDPSGMFDFSNIQSDKTVIENELTDTANVYSMHMYYTGYQTMRFENGFMSFV